MNRFLGLMLFFVMLLTAAPAFSAEAMQLWRCEFASDEVTEEDVIEGVKKWLAAAQTVPGGAGFKASVHFPVAVNATGQIDALFVVVAPSFEDWGKFWDHYPDSDAADIEDVTDQLVICPDSAVWETTRFE